MTNRKADGEWQLLTFMMSWSLEENEIDRSQFCGMRVGPTNMIEITTCLFWLLDNDVEM